MRNISQNVRTGDKIAQIAPENSYLVIKGLVRNADISKVEIGQQVQMRISASSYPEQPLSNSFGQKGKICDLQLGMEGRVDIISREETVMTFLLRKARIMTDLSESYI